MSEKRFGALSSSEDPQKLSLTITSTVQLIIGALVSFGLLSTVGADTILEQVPIIVSAGFATYQGCLALYGAVRKIIVSLSEQK
jgi:hypothetical protein